MSEPQNLGPNAKATVSPDGILTITIDLKEEIGKTGGNNIRIATTGAPQAIADHKGRTVKVGLNVWRKP